MGVLRTGENHEYRLAVPHVTEEMAEEMWTDVCI